MDEQVKGRIRLPGQTAIVTGASSGIGAGIAETLGAAGANVVVNYAGHREGAEDVVRRIKNGGADAFPWRADVSSEVDVQAMFQAAIEEYGTVDILVSNAGVQKDAPLLDMTLDQWKTVMGINLTGAFLCAREAAGSLSGGEWSLSDPGPSEKSSLSVQCMKLFPGPAM